MAAPSGMAGVGDTGREPVIRLGPDGAKRSYPFQGDETLEFIPLGAGNEVGRSCCLLKFKGKTIMFDCGAHPGYRGEESLPFFDEVDADTIDLLLVTHFHVDHAAAVPYFLTKTTFKGKVYMTYPTLAICKLVWSDFIKVSGIAEQHGGSLYTEKDIQDTISAITCIDYHQEVEVEGVRFWCYNAGHVLGACMFMVQIAGVRLLYTGDYSRQEDRHLMAAEMPAVKVHVLVVESTYGIQTHEPRRPRERQFLESVVTTLQHGGRVLLPVFAIGRAQELLLLLDEWWRKTPELQRFPVICLSGMARRCIASYQTYINQMNNRIRHLNDIENPFDFRHIRYMTSISEFEDNTPCVVMASPGMLQNGPSRDLFDRWCEDKRNAVVVTGYCVSNTLAKDLLDSEPKSHTLQGAPDFMQTSQFIDELRPSHIVLVHGEANMMASLKKQLVSKYEQTGVGVWSPQNTEAVTLTFHESKVAKVVGSIAAERPRHGLQLEGVVLHKNFQLTIVSIDDMAAHAGLQVSHLIQRQHIPFSQPWGVLVFHLSKLFDSIAVLSDPKGDAPSPAEPQDTAMVDEAKAENARQVEQMVLESNEEKALPIRVMDAVTVRKSTPGVVEIEWQSNPVNDLVADSVLSVMMQSLISPQTSKAMARTEASPQELGNVVKVMLEERYGAVEAASEGGEPVFQFVVDDTPVTVDALKETVTCADADIQRRVEGAVKKMLACLHPTGRNCDC